ncbi:hypothetical protein [Thermomonas sp.]|uniref:hypothetical protein n=1 Tax=Thermomonas sp. TaxID=1971895 RepID=UPI00248A370A|nr:hypothetical protein [Thermomonas sp.]MDI1253755.1 hypothetical protein [Thermomonas sp.]
MNQRPPQSPHLLDAEERALAKALPRLHGRTAPAPDLDASILAAAQAAVRPARPAKSPTRPRVSWIAPIALAASMVLAVSMAWQLRPLPGLEAAQPAAQPDASDTQAVRMFESLPTDIPVPMVQSKPAPVPVPSIAPAPQQATSSVVGAQEALPPADDQSLQTPVPLLSPSARPIAAAPSSPAPPAPTSAMSAEAASGAAPPAKTLDPLRASDRTMRARTTAPAAAAKASSDFMVRDDAPAADKSGVADSARQAAANAVRPAPAAPVPPVGRNEAELAADAGFVDDPGVDIPPATAASPAVRDAWLHRIGELLEQGKRQDAKASLAEFRRRYPAAVLPPALHALEIEH